MLINAIPTPEDEGTPVEWPESAVQLLVAKEPQELLQMLVEQLHWYLEEDDVNLTMAGNEPWIEGYFRAKALMDALKQHPAELFKTLSIPSTESLRT